MFCLQRRLHDYEMNESASLQESSNLRASLAHKDSALVHEQKEKAELRDKLRSSETELNELRRESAKLHGRIEMLQVSSYTSVCRRPTQMIPIKLLINTLILTPIAYSVCFLGIIALINEPVSPVVKHALSVWEVWVRFPGRSNRTHCRQRLCTAAMFLRSCVDQALSRTDQSASRSTLPPLL